VNVAQERTHDRHLHHVRRGNLASVIDAVRHASARVRKSTRARAWEATTKTSLNEIASDRSVASLLLVASTSSRRVPATFIGVCCTIREHHSREAVLVRVLLCVSTLHAH
jgi:hypothetical protein